VDRLAQASAYRLAGRYRDALGLLEGSEDWSAPENEPATLLRGQILARLDPLKALELLARTQDLFESTEGRFGYLVASMRAYIGTRNYEAATEMAERADGLAARVALGSRVHLWHHRALLRLCLEQFDPLDDDIVALMGTDDPNGRFLGHLMRSYMHAGFEQYVEQTADLISALEIACSNPGACDPGIVALQVFALLRLALEMGNEAAFSAAIEAYEWMPWSDDLRDDEFQCVRALAWNAFLRGEPAQAQWLLKDSKGLAKQDAWKVMAHLDRAYVARINGNEHWAAEELLTAHAIARNVEWSATKGEERQALVMLAVLFAPTDMAQAQHYVSLYMQIGRETVNPVLSLAHDRRAVAFEKYALGRVQQVLGNKVLAIKSFETAYDIFDRAQYHFRAALCALGLFETTRDEKWLQQARRHAAFFPNSALNVTLNQEDSAGVDVRLRELTPLQRQLALALCEGLDMAQLSQRFSRSAFSLQKHVDVVYGRFGVKHRNGLRSALQSWTLV
jgi:DNA-binding CsgD family transcriptional regulator